MAASAEKPHERIAEAKRRAAEGPPFLEFAFRPFFLAAALWAAVSVALWAGFAAGYPTLPAWLDGLAWHRHETLYGFAAAAVAGFILTAIPNWTGRLPVSGAGLAVLAAIWAAGRAAMLFDGAVWPALVAAVDLLFPVALIAVVGREIIAGGNWRNLPQLALILLFMSGSAVYHAERLGAAVAYGLDRGLGLYALALLIALIGGRVIPSFTRNWLVKRGAERLPASFDGFDKVALGLLGAFVAAALVVPDTAVAGVLAGLAAAAHLVRLARWRGLATVAEPLLWVLHAGYLWLVVALAFAAAAAFGWAPKMAEIHSLGAGAVATMIVAVSTRATLGHTGHPLTAGAGTTAIYLLVIAAGVLRVGAPFAGAAATALRDLSAVAWVAGFALYVVLYLPLWLKPQAGR